MWLRKKRYAWPIGSWAPASAPRFDAGEEGFPVSLGGNKPETDFPLLELVDQVQLVIPLDRLRVSAGGRIPDRGQQQHQRGQPLLAIHDQIRGHTARRGRDRRQDDAPEEMT